MTRCRAAMLALALTAPAAALGAPLARTEVPIAAVTLTDGARRYTVPVQVGGVSLVAGLDTGSTGLRILARAIPAAANLKGPAARYGYASGIRIDGTIVTVPLAIGALAGERLPVQRIDAIGCGEHHAGCPADRIAPADYGLQGDGLKGEGFAAIIGLNMGEDAARNPLIALGATRWIIELPRPGDGAPGRLVIQPSDAEVVGYARVALLPATAQARSGVHDAIAGCVIRTDTNVRTCGPLILDSGAPGIRISLPGFVPWPQGTPGLLVIGDGRRGGGEDAGTQTLAFVAGRREQASGMFVESVGPNGVAHISAGLMPYFGWSVLYDAKAGAIGFKRRD